MSTTAQAHSDVPAGALRQILVVALYELKAMLVSARTLLLFVGYGSVCLAIGTLYVSAVKQLGEQMASQGMKTPQGEVIRDQLQSEQFRAQVEPMLQWLNANQLFDALVEGQMPWVVALILLLSAFALMALIVLVCYDRIADDLRSRFTRYVFLRVRRGNYLLGKILGQCTGVMTTIVVVHLLLLVLAAVTPELDAAAIAYALPGVWLAMVVFVLGYISYTALFSVVLGRPFAALALAAVGLFVLWIISLATTLGSWWMGAWDRSLWALDPVAFGVFAVHSVLFIALAYFALRRRDV